MSFEPGAVFMTGFVLLAQLAAGCSTTTAPLHDGMDGMDGGVCCARGAPLADAGRGASVDAGRQDASLGSPGLDASPGAALGDATGVRAVAATDFLNSLGVCTHVAQGVDSPTESASAMAYAGLRNLRDDGRATAVSSWIAMHQSAGVRVCLLSNQDLQMTLAMAKQLRAADALLAVEGPNEPNNFAVTYQGQTSSNKTFLPVAHFQADLYAAVLAEPSLQGIPVFHASEAGGAEPDDVGLQFLTIPAQAKLAMPDGTRYADYANTHNYICGHSSKLVDNLAWSASDPTLNGDWDGLYVEYGHTWAKGFPGYSNAELVALPRVTTETGWVTQGAGAISEEQQARLFMNLYLSAFARGVTHTFIYMLRDDPVQGYWGLFDSHYQPKKSGVYLHNLTSILADSASGPTSKLDFAIANQPATVHTLLLQKSSGSFALVLWDERPLGGSDTVSVDLKTQRALVNVYDPTSGVTALQTLHDVRMVSLTLSDHPMVLEL